MKFYAPIFFLIVACLANGSLCAQEYDGAPISIGNSSLFDTTGNFNWPYVITLAETSDGASSQEEQSLDINVTSLPVGAQYRVLKTMSNGTFFNGNPQALSDGSNKITIDAVDFDRTVKVQFSSGDIIFDTLIVNKPPLTISIDDFAGLNTAASTSDLAISVTENGLGLILGPGSSTLGRDAFGTGTSQFGQTGEWFDGSFVKFGNSGNQQILDFRITNNTGADAKLKNISFDLRRPPGNPNFATDFQLLYLATGDSNLIKGSSVAEGSEMVNLVGIGSDVLEVGINNFSEFIGQNISGTAWIADGGYANIRLKLNTTAPQAATQLDNLIISLEVLEVLPPQFTSLATASAIAENSGAFQAIYTAEVEDDSDVTFDLKGVDDFASFAIDESTGVVTLKDDPDYESKTSYSFTVVATKGSDNSSEQMVTLSIIDLDDNLSYFLSLPIAPPVTPFSGANQVVYIAEADDLDESSVVTYSLKLGDDSSSFTINGDTGEVTLIEDPDEANSPYTFTVIARDRGDNPVELEVTLNVSNDITNPVFSDTPGGLDIPENSGGNQLIYNVLATDDSGVIIYSIKMGDDSEFFSINESTGDVTLKEDPDYELKSSYSFFVVASDESGNSAELPIILNIIDLNDTVPIFISSTKADTIEENIGAGRLIYTADAVDDTGVINYSLKVGYDSDSFSINESTGEVKLLEDPDYETQSSYKFIVIATNAFDNKTELTVTLEVSDLGRFVDAGAVDIGNDWRWINWLGYFYVTSDSWVYHIEHEWLYIFTNFSNFDSVYFWDDTMKSVLWTSEEMYPVLYRFSDKKWIWYLKESKDPRQFVDLATSEWEEID